MALLDLLRAPRTRRYLILGALWATVAATLVIFREVLLLFSVALLLAYVLSPLVRRMASWNLRGRHLPRWVCVILIYLAVFGLAYLFAVTVVPQFYREGKRLAAEAGAFLNALTPQTIDAWTAKVQDFVAERGIPLDVGPEGEGGRLGISLDLAESLRQGLESLSADLRDSLPRVFGVAQTLVGRVLGGVFGTFFTLMVTAFVLIDLERIKEYVFTLLPVDHHDRYEALVDRIDDSLSGVVRGQLLICLVNGTLTLAGMLLLKVKFAFVLSGFAMVMSLIPIFGSIFSSVPIVAVGLTQGWHTAVGALGWIIGIHALEAYFLNPKIMGAAAKIHPVLVAFALIAGERTFGFVGALFAVPVASILINVFVAVHHYALGLQKQEPAAAGPG